FESIVNRLEELYAQVKPLVDEYKDKKPSEQALKIWTERYFMTYTDGEKDTSLDDAFRRIARSIAAADVNYAQTAEQLHRLEEIYYNIFSARLMLLNSPALFNFRILRKKSQL
ncbi:MAG: ribonucleotide reductase N-terminal alpha domain-containing protein, partial [Candidatus Freyarchaeota archaeon]